jgi:expansin (peptidoglycan-binding protein)
MLRPRRVAFGLPLAILVAACGGATGDLHGGNGGGGGGGGGTGGAVSMTTTVGTGPTAACGEAIQHAGDATFYAADGSGNCSFEPTGDLMIGAMNQSDYAGSAACGACAHLVGPSGEVTVRIVDRCPGCDEGDIDLSPDAFSHLADPSLGRVPMTWKYVACDVTGPLVYHFKDGSNEWWTAVQIRSSRYAIAKLEIQKDGQYVNVDRADYNYFVADAGMGPGPYAFRVTDVNGHAVEESGIPLVVGDATGTTQLPICAP